MKSACCCTPTTTIDSKIHGLGQAADAEPDRQRDHAHRLRDGGERTPRPTAPVSGASSAALRMRRAEALPEPAALFASGRRSVAELLAPAIAALHASAPSQISFTSCLPKLRPFSRPMNASGADVDAFGDRLAVLQLAGGDQHAELLQRLRPDVHVLADDEAFDVRRDCRISCGCCSGIGCAVVAADHSAQGDAAERVHARQHGVEHRPADVLEVAVDAVRASLPSAPGTATSDRRAPCSRCRRRSRARRVT